MSHRRGLLGFGSRSSRPEAQSSSGSGPYISATPESGSPPQSAAASGSRRPKGKSVAQIRAECVRRDGRILFQRNTVGKLIEPPGISTCCTNSFKRIPNPGGYTWKLTPPTVQELYFEEFKKEFTWDPEDEADVKDMWLEKARKRYSDNMSEYKRLLKQKTEAGEMMETPLGMSDTFWTGIKAYWDQDEVKAVSRRARENRYSEPDGVGTGISRHVGGSQSSRILQQSLLVDGEVPPTASNYSTFLRLHMYADGTFVSEKDANLDAEIHRVAAETGREDRLDEVYLELVRPGRSRLYGTGSAGVSQFSRGSTNSTCSSQMSQRMYETRISTLEERLQNAEEDRAAQEAAREAEQAAREALEQRMSQLEEILRRSGQLP
ncbi:uncharacterized protein LOC131016903 [Salvia miltiorrhiza]|uniref:uncharacterized protein LOC131007127 n=1 Tax=Salvia miltiorrhiza TaxID=226208 RepID=UPI0025AC9C38|nr:uncharacterized protein LOC131007127 [Salvia miltiorrhiza]XP_057801687.1 uncharacterized protein LOC131016903 [Salvia miltiorrhiza]